MTPPWPLPPEPAPSPPPLIPARTAAVEALRLRSWPNPKDEAWRHSPLRALSAALQGLDTARESPRTQAVPIEPPWTPVEARAAAPLPHGVHLLSFEEAANRCPEHLSRLGGALPAGRSPLADANTAGFTTGWLLHVEAGATVEEPLWLALPWSGKPLQRPRLLIVLERGASLRLAQHHMPAAAEAVRLEVTEALLGQGARLEQLLLLRPGRGRLLGHLAARLEAGASHRLLALELGGTHGRLEVHQHLDGEGAEAHVAAVLHAAERQAVELHLHTEHIGPHGTSSQLVRALAEGRGRAVADARALVRPGATGCEVDQRLDGLLMDRGARAVCRPELTIEVDEVVARHGATVGALDEAARFYLRSRGLDAEEAETLLRAAFLAAPLNGLEAEPLHAEAASALTRFLGHPLPTEPMRGTR